MRGDSSARHRRGTLSDGRVAAPAAAAAVRVRRGGRLGDGRGLTAAGGVALLSAMGLAGAILDIATGSGLRVVFAVCFALGCGVAAATVHREDQPAAVVMAPLVFLGLVAVASSLEAGGMGGSGLSRRLLDIVTAMVTSAPVLLAGTGVALLAVVVRVLVYRASVRRRRSRRAARAGRPAATGTARSG